MNYQNEFKYAQKLMKEVFKKVNKSANLAIAEKGDRTLVTEMDVAIEEYLVYNIKLKYPKDHFVTEERNPNNLMKDRTWVIDPIDGTVCFIKGIPTWGIQMAFVDNGIVQFSVIYLPAVNELYTCYRGQGVSLNGTKLPNPSDNPANICVTEYCGRIGISDREITAKIYRELDDIVKNQLAFGASCCSFVNIATGRCDAFISGCNAPWDICAGETMLKEQGCNIYKSKLGISIYSNSSELFRTMKNIVKNLEKECN